jgi:hypothetical protein
MDTEINKLCNEVHNIVDTGGWIHSIHWERGEDGHYTLKGLGEALRDLGCKDEADEIRLETIKIKKRYELARRISKFIKESKEIEPS